VPPAQTGSGVAPKLGGGADLYPGKLPALSGKRLLDAWTAEGLI